MKRLLPVLIEKTRYIAFAVDKKTSFHDFEARFKNQSSSFLGTFGLSLSKPLLLKKDYSFGFGILKVSVGFVPHAKTIFALMGGVRSLKVFGTLKKARSYLSSLRRNV